ncbi:MAG: bifunctional methylenetetrahydrofolate dehydrogenase/methenyltetrahydrofolate cyclohydrolase FolD [Proteobacteria bacterium]|nr:bifunctional methylenetetrahydrofolate dehydrogenase/methenyltetrahydrofolate cyclohydrolase FolD [Pseudomonadota bacterium]
MEMQLLDGNALAKKIRAEVKAAAEAFAAQTGRRPGLHVVIVGADPASEIYVRNKRRDCEKAGLVSEEHRLPADTAPGALLGLLARLNADDAVDGVIVQLPIPPHLDVGAVIAAIDPAKDVDGFHPLNLGRLVAGEPGLVACTPSGCMRLLDEAKVALAGADAVVVGRSTIVGKPMALLLLQRHATVTVCHSRTRDLAAVIGRADVVVAAVGVPGLVRGEWVKPGAAVVDVGINRRDDGSLVGDVGFEAAAERAGWITPVPGGVGPMTRACLLENTIRAARRRAAQPAP